MVEYNYEINQKGYSLSGLALTPAQCRAARALIEWSQEALSNAANVSRHTVKDFERGVRTPYPNNMAAIRSALEGAGVQFIPENGGGVGVRLIKGIKA
ncbi:helix-turn-helix domain-containing protein [Acetobacter okinawensis]|uniref:helix-turn-helix domain-containing protein n=1 Tax=Acetobacter okinawensis TaxID=1076594 RepID=UPI000B0A8733|nr:helix-turn-helix domain-containing protein [Acetobacter okinawensis]